MSMKRSWQWVLAVVVTLYSLEGIAAGTAASRILFYEARVYQVLTNVVDVDVTAPRPEGWMHSVHQRLDDVELVMDGDTLVWSGRAVPDNPRIIKIGEPCLSVLEGESASIAVGSDVKPQYMERKEENLFELKTDSTSFVGFQLHIDPQGAIQDRSLTCNVRFSSSCIKEREAVKGVNLDVGRPIIASVGNDGPVTLRLGEWACYQVSQGAEGWVFLFLRATVMSEKEVTDMEKQSKAAVKEGKEVGLDEGGEAKQGGPTVRVGGSIQVRGGYMSGGHDPQGGVRSRVGVEINPSAQDSEDGGGTHGYVELRSKK